MKISVILPVYNSARYLNVAIDSVLSQTYKNFEFIIINDGSVDRTEAIISSCQDPRIKLIKHNRRLGIVKSLNQGLKMAKGKYVIRMDADDISFTQRFEKQINFMESNPKIAISGSWVEVFGTKNYYWRPPTTHETIKSKLMFESSLIHPSVIFRRQAIIKNKLFYRPNYNSAEDYDLWSRAADKTKLGNLNQVLLKYRQHHSQVTKSSFKQQLNSADKIRKKLIKRLKLNPSSSELKLHSQLSQRKSFSNKKSLLNAKNWLTKLVQANQTVNYFDRNAFLKVINQKWLSALCSANFSKTERLKIFINNPLLK